MRTYPVSDQSQTLGGFDDPNNNECQGLSDKVYKEEDDEEVSSSMMITFETMIGISLLISNDVSVSIVMDER